MSHWILAPVLFPALAAIILLLSARASKATHQIVSVLSTTAVLVASIALVLYANEGTRDVYALGGWPVPFGIVLVLDRLSALMVLLTTIVGMGAVLYAVRGWDQRGKNFHALFQFQLMGINGAFLTGDAFNLFVFFEILLIASYGLLVHGGGIRRIKAGLHYVIFNLTGSALFIIALGLLYGSLGTLNMADMSVRISELDPHDIALVRATGLLLFVVFSIKAAVLPLYFWLPGTYSAASAPVAALFAIMTKVGLYSILRASTLLFGANAGELAHLAEPWLLPAGLVTMLCASLGALSSKDLRGLISYLVIASVGTLLIAFALPGVASLSAAMYYMVHSTIIMAALFLVADLVGRSRGAYDDLLESARPVARPAALGSMFFIGAIAASGMPPLSGFFGKLFILESAVGHEKAAAVFFVILLGGLIGLVGLSRAGSVIFWKTAPTVDGENRDEIEHGENGDAATPAVDVTLADLVPPALLIALTALMVVAAGPIYEFMHDLAAQTLDVDGYIRAVFALAENVEVTP